VHVTRHLHIVLSQPPEGVSEEDFNRWYDAHVPEILRAPGFVSARRYRLQPVVSDVDRPVPYGYLAVYEIEGDPATAVAELEQLGMGSKDSYASLKADDVGDLELPSWWDEVRFASWNCLAVGEKVEAVR
jgi:hypothetical protein